MSDKTISTTQAAEYGFKTLEQCERELLLLGLTEGQVNELNVTLRKIAESVMDAYFDE